MSACQLTVYDCWYSLVLVRMGCSVVVVCVCAWVLGFMLRITVHPIEGSKLRYDYVPAPLRSDCGSNLMSH